MHIDVPLKIQSYIQAQLNQQKAFPVPFRQGILRVDMRWLTVHTDAYNGLS